MNSSAAIPRLFFLVLFFLVSATAQSKSGRVPLFDGLGDHHHAVTTSSPLAQRYFDQGMMLAFAFNHDEAHRSFRQAAQLDPKCAMAWWGAAWVLGPSINTEMERQNVQQAWHLLIKAKDAARHVTERERAYINALHRRYGPVPLQVRHGRDREFAEGMADVAARFPEDLDAQVIYAEALMHTTHGHYWKSDGSPTAVAERILTILEGVLERNPDHPHANHLYIHTVEKGRPELGLKSAERLETLVPGAGHLLHVPAHIYIRTGHYHKATAANLRAIKADQNYLQQVNAAGIYRLGYVPHNYHFGWATASLEGRSRLAVHLAQETAALVDPDVMRQRNMSTLQHYWVTPLYAMIRFGRWDDILRYPEPDKDLIYPRGVWHYAQGMAQTRRADFSAAHEHLVALNELRRDSSLEWVTIWDINRSDELLDIAFYQLGGELTAAEGNVATAVKFLQQAVAREEALDYDEPPTWHYPARQALGAVLLQAGQAGQAEAVYRRDLEVFPYNGWSLFGLLESLHEQGRSEEAAQVERKFEQAWRHADIVLTGSRF
ncbi:hypothetical protein F6455_08425 [Proteobacteria bacterium 005FR1]|nr:hypothetical protein [Proteobacteria bacterium 005FR1]